MSSIRSAADQPAPALDRRGAFSCPQPVHVRRFGNGWLGERRRSHRRDFYALLFQMVGPFGDILATVRSAAGQIRVRSALNPMLWLCAIVSTPAFILALRARDFPALANVLMVVGTAPVLVTLVGFLYFMVTAPQRLQSEEFQLRHQALDLIRTKGSDIVVSPSSIEAIANPAVAALPMDRP